MEFQYIKNYLPLIPVNKPTYVIQYFCGDTVESVLVEDCPNVVYAIIQARDDPAHRDYRISLSCDQTIPVYPPCDTDSIYEQTYEIHFWEPSNRFPYGSYCVDDPDRPISYIITKWLVTQCRSVLEAIAWAKESPYEIYQIYLPLAGTPWLVYGKFPEKITDEEYPIVATSARMYSFFEPELEEYLEP